MKLLTIISIVFIGLSYCSSAQIIITEMETQTNQSLRLWFHSQGDGSTYTVQFCPDLSGSNGWKNVAGALISGLGSNVYEAASISITNGTGFFRVLSAEELRGWFDETEITIDEGSGTVTLSIRFNGHYSGTLAYIIEGTGIADIDDLSGTVQVNGTTANIIISLKDNARIDPLRHISISLLGSSSVAVGNAGSATLNLVENDAIWQGILETDTGVLGFQLEMIDDGAILFGEFSGGDFGFFPSNPLPATVSLSDDSFVAAIINISIEPEANVYATPMILEFALSANDAEENEKVEPDLIEGSCSLVINIPAMPYLNATNQGTFALQKPPVNPSTNEVSLVNIP